MTQPSMVFRYVTERCDHCAGPLLNGKCVRDADFDNEEIALLEWLNLRETSRRLKPPVLSRHHYRKPKGENSSPNCQECGQDYQNPVHLKPWAIAERPAHLADALVIATVVCPDTRCRAAIDAPCTRRSFGSGVAPGPHHARRLRAQSVLSNRAARSARVVAETEE